MRETRRHSPENPELDVLPLPSAVDGDGKDEDEDEDDEDEEEEERRHNEDEEEEEEEEPIWTAPAHRLDPTARGTDDCLRSLRPTDFSCRRHPSSREDRLGCLLRSSVPRVR